MKVQPQDATRRTWPMAGDLGRPLHDLLAVSRISRHLEDRGRNSPHGVQRRPVNEQGVG
ncbi:hypothetical protein [Novilysobacter spongiicola]|uniref:hypothetical protein n=1 Tax=Novilysobacter spongiicola TaxID=435289 RepID=UPI001F331E49|nr:hypothetical protein [Lysobacter spongiicola]